MTVASYGPWSAGMGKQWSMRIDRMRVQGALRVNRAAYVGVMRLEPRVMEHICIAQYNMVVLKGYKVLLDK